MTLTEINRGLSEKKIFLVEEKGLADWAKQLERKSNREVRRTTFWGITKMIKVKNTKKSRKELIEIQPGTNFGGMMNEILVIVATMIKAKIYLEQLLEGQWTRSSWRWQRVRRGGKLGAAPGSGGGSCPPGNQISQIFPTSQISQIIKYLKYLNYVELSNIKWASNISNISNCQISQIFKISQIS